MSSTQQHKIKITNSKSQITAFGGIPPSMKRGSGGTNLKFQISNVWRLVFRQWILFGIWCLGFGIFAAATPALAAPEYDLAIGAGDISYVPAEPIEGQKFRVYARVQNVGSKDVSGFVTFYQGPAVIGTSQVVSVRAGGSPDEVFVDWVAPAGAFNILARIQGQEPADENTANEETVSPMIAPLRDTDKDGIPDRDDPDQDNDTVLNTVEGARGTNPLVQDSDGDGVNDAHDAFPLDPTRSVAPPPPPPPQQTKAQPLQVLSSVTPVQQQQKKQGAKVVTGESKKEDAPIVLPLETSRAVEAPWVEIGSERVGWNQFQFRFTTNVVDLEHALISWDFGDHEQSRDVASLHTYSSAGVYPVRLTLVTKEGALLTNEMRVDFSFFHPRNRQFWGLILVLLVVASIPLVYAYVRSTMAPDDV